MTTEEIKVLFECALESIGLIEVSDDGGVEYLDNAYDIITAFYELLDN